MHWPQAHMNAPTSFYKHLQCREAEKTQRWCWQCPQSLCVMMKQGYTGELERTDDHKGGKIVVDLPG
uniref:Uncharacterized protein n=1 Tax=Strix occidentalis caurina TaxID=311401 RepID=A0A8D0KWN7_STROC